MKEAAPLVSTPICSQFVCPLHTRAKIYRHIEEAVLDSDAIGDEWPGYCAAAAGDVEQREGQIVGATDGTPLLASWPGS